MANSVDPDQTAPIGAVCSGSTLFASILNWSVMLGNYLQQTTSVDDIFKCIFFLGAFRVKQQILKYTTFCKKWLYRLLRNDLKFIVVSDCCIPYHPLHIHTYTTTSPSTPTSPRHTSRHTYTCNFHEKR